MYGVFWLPTFGFGVQNDTARRGYLGCHGFAGGSLTSLPNGVRKVLLTEALMAGLLVWNGGPWSVWRVGSPAAESPI